MGEGGGANAVTDDQGRYRFPVPSPGIYNVWLKAFDEDPSKTAVADDVTDAGVGHFRTHKRLEHVTLRVTGLTDDLLGHLAQVETLTGLELYGSGKSGVAPGRNFSVAGLQQLKKLPKLHRLGLSNFDIPGGGYGELKELKHLRELTFMMTNITDAELESLEEALPATRISALTGGRAWIRPKRKR